MSDDAAQKRRGRPRVHASDADRARAWREQQKARLALVAEPVVVEKVVEKVVERVVERPVRPKKGLPTPQAEKAYEMLRPNVTMASRAADTKRLRTNVGRVAGAIDELRSLLRSPLTTDYGRRRGAEDEVEFLDVASTFFSELNRLLARAQGAAEQESARKEKEAANQRAAELLSIQATMLDPLPEDELVSMALHLVEFDTSNTGTLWLSPRRQGYSVTSFPLWNQPRLKYAAKNRDLPGIKRELAQAIREAPKKGRFIGSKELGFYEASWDDFLEFHHERK